MLQKEVVMPCNSLWDSYRSCKGKKLPPLYVTIMEALIVLPSKTLIATTIE